MISVFYLLEAVAFTAVVLTLWPLPGWPAPLAVGLSMWGALLALRVARLPVEK